MKKKLNVFCVMVMLILSYSVLEAAYYVGLGFTFGVETGLSEISVAQKQELMNLQAISLLPDFQNQILGDSVYNEKSGRYVPATYGQIAVSVDIHHSVFTKSITLLADCIYIIAVVWAVVLFLRLIISINKSDIFNWRNVRRLRRMGVMLTVCFISRLIPAFVTVYKMDEFFALKGYRIFLSDMLDYTSLILGISSLIVAEVFAIGLKMREEQDLTI